MLCLCCWMPLIPKKSNHGVTQCSNIASNIMAEVMARYGRRSKAEEKNAWSVRDMWWKKSYTISLKNARFVKTLCWIVYYVILLSHPSLMMKSKWYTFFFQPCIWYTFWDFGQKKHGTHFCVLKGSSGIDTICTNPAARTDPTPTVISLRERQETSPVQSLGNKSPSGLVG